MQMIYLPQKHVTRNSSIVTTINNNFVILLSIEMVCCYLRKKKIMDELKRHNNIGRQNTDSLARAADLCIFSQRLYTLATFLLRLSTSTNTGRLTRLLSSMYKDFAKKDQRKQRKISLTY